ncbi:MAG: hypothetical protein A2710_24370 [Burkholderiales bacterium RIFCSPHIGHO2_01_FULL_64_960]|nr:MAG: hypothetical protein A2710_24370 [Burkholderiales bacterium RIFCSPHIGHO2_01_FULL_64_960]
MQPGNPVEIEDVGDAIREGRDLRQATQYRIQFALDTLNFKALSLADPIPLGRQILASAGLNPGGDYSLFAILAENGDFEDVRLDEPFDLRGRGAERFIAFSGDRTFKIKINNSQVSWGSPTISASDLFALAGLQDGEAVFLVVRGGEDREIFAGDVLDLSLPSVEHFETVRKRVIEIVVNGREVEVAESRQTFEQLVALAYTDDLANPTTDYSVSYRRAASVPHSGELSKGGFIMVKNGSIINVGRTIQS